MCRTFEMTHVLGKWAEHFDELLNIERSNPNATSKEMCQAYLDTDETTPTLDEVENAIQRLKDNKAPGMDLILIIIIGIQPLGRFGQRPELSQSTGIALVRCILGKFLGVVYHCFPPRLDVPTFATRCLLAA